MRRISHFSLLAAIVCLMLGATVAHAEDVRVSAGLSDESAQVGDEVQYTIKVGGASDASVPENIDVDGLQITHTGHQFQFNLTFGSSEHSVIHTYSIVANRPGDFVIPPQQVVVDGQTYMTKPVRLKIGGNAAQAGGGSGGGGSGGGDNDNGSLYYAEIVVPQDTAYIGEAVPVEIKIYVDTRVRAYLQEMPEVSAQGCTVQKLAKPDQTTVTRNGHEYNVVTYKTAITPAQAGHISVGPVILRAQAQLPMVHQRRHFNNPLDDMMAQMDNFPMMAPPQDITIRGEAVEMTGKTLPAAGQPASFAGAVGTFTLTTSAKPAMVEAGDPITLTVQIAGNGDFDRVTAPEVTNPDGWKIYPPTSKFDADDDVGISGVKTFEMAIIPQTKKTKTPSMAWSYFDPAKERYITLDAEQWPVKVEGEPQAATPALVAQASPSAAQASATPAAPDILYIRADSTGWGETFEPLYANRVFWAAQGAPLLALLGFVGLQIVRKRAADERARRIAQWRREREMELARMQRRDTPESELYQAAAHAMRLEAAIQTDRVPETLGGPEVLSARELDEALAQRVRNIFDHQAEVLYAGTASARGAASAQVRTDALETVKGYENAKPAAE
ncbi:MAG TPA: BatD family protein [Chthoniobacteraceae bacterium]|jgi:hypothetical protein|nr:BatD family protein [Chthoniobacteraceae bacterium]